MQTENSGAIAKEAILEMTTDGATKAAIAKAVGVSEMTILNVTSGTTTTFRKLPKLQRVLAKWKAGKLDLSSKRRRGQVVAPVADDIPVSKKTPTGKKAPMKTTKTAKKPVETKKTKPVVRPRKEKLLPTPAGFQLPEVTMEMVAGVEEQIRRLQAQAKFMRDLIAIRKKYGQ